MSKFSKFKTLLSKKSKKSGKGIMPFMTLIKMSVLMLTLFAGMSYMLQINDTATKGYVIRDLEGKKTDLEDEIASLQVYTAKLQSLSRVQKATKDKDMVRLSNVEYVDGSLTSVAIK